MASTETQREYMRAYYLAHSTRPRMIYGATRTSKMCKKCGVEKLRDEFMIGQTGQRIGHLSAYCKPCSSELNRVAHERDSTLYRRVEWPSKLKRKYGITVEEYNRMLLSQGGGCAICGSKTPRTRTYGNIKKEDVAFSVDHCHKTGNVRGLLCTACNRVLGLIGDSPETAKSVINYLSRSKSFGK